MAVQVHNCKSKESKDSAWYLEWKFLFSIKDTLDFFN